MQAITDITYRMYKPVFNPVRHLVEADLWRHELYIRVSNICSLLSQREGN